MSAGIKRMLAEKAQLAEQDRVGIALGNTPKKLLEVEAAMKMIDLAQPFIDEYATDPTKWNPSALLRIGYCVIGTGEHPKDALAFVEAHLTIARKRYLAGKDPNPFGPARTIPALGQTGEATDGTA